jgi:hypothetical protein
LFTAVFGLLVPNGLFIHWVVKDFHGIQPILQNHLALAFILDAFLALGILSIYFAFRPIGKVHWAWFLILSLAGGLGFSLPFYWWLNTRTTKKNTTA